MKRFILFLLFIMTLTGCTDIKKDDAEQSQRRLLSVAGQSVVAEIAATPVEQQRGLSGRAQLPEGTGMLFPITNPSVQTFWMKDMLIEIDIIWIRDHHVIGIESRVVADDGLRRYSSPSTVDMVLELPAGWSERHGLQVGDEIL